MTGETPGGRTPGSPALFTIDPSFCKIALWTVTDSRSLVSISCSRTQSVVLDGMPRTCSMSAP